MMVAEDDILDVRYLDLITQFLDQLLITVVYNVVVKVKSPVTYIN